VGDSGHEQKGQNVRVEGNWVLQDTDTASGVFLEKTITVKPESDRLSVTIGKKVSDKNTCLCWLVLRRL